MQIEYNEIYEFLGDFMNDYVDGSYIDITRLNNTCSGTLYTIKEGDTLYKISRTYNIPLELLLESNSNVNIYNLNVGDKICIPRRLGSDSQENNKVPNNDNSNINPSRMFVYVVKDGDTIESILDRYDIGIEDLMDGNKQNKIMLKPGSIVVVPAKERD